jgi:hypothetical protein
MAFVPISGYHIPGTPDTPQDPGDRLRVLYKAWFPGPPPVAHEVLSDEEVVRKATEAHGKKFSALLTDENDGMDGLALANHLAFWCRRDPAQMCRLFSKYWPARGGRLSFLEPTIFKALEGLPAFKDVPVATVPADDPAVGRAVGLAERLEGKGWPLWRAVFELARHLLPLGGDPRRLRPAVDAFARRLAFDLDESWGRFRQNWEKVRHPDGLFEEAVRLADEKPVVVSADYSPLQRRLADIAYYLGNLTEDGVFFLAQMKLAEVLGTKQPTVSTTINTLRMDGYLQAVEEKYTFGHGKKNRAKTYRWTG